MKDCPSGELKQEVYVTTRRIFLHYCELQKKKFAVKIITNQMFLKIL